MPIQNRHTAAAFDSIARTIDRVERSGADPEILAYLSSYLVVMVCGTYEACIENLISERAAKANDPEICQYVTSSIGESFRNPKFSRITEILGKFSAQYAEALNKTVPLGSKEALASIVNNKNAIAHGSPSNVTLADVKGFHNRCVVIFEELEKVLR